MTLLLIDDTSAIVLISSDIVQLTEIQQVYLINWNNCSESKVIYSFTRPVKL